VVGSLPPQQPPKSFAQNLDILMSGSVHGRNGHSRVGGKAGRQVIDGGGSRWRFSETRFCLQADDRMS
jgi:hypothetical protein